MSSELQQQKALAELLTLEYNQLGIDAKVYSGNEFKRLNNHWAKKPDLIIINSPQIFHRHLNDSLSMNPPIGIEYKKEIKVTQFVRAVKLQAQDRYKDGLYKINKTNENINLNTIAYSHEEFIKSGLFSKTYPSHIYTRQAKSIAEIYRMNDLIEEIEYKWAERICWAFDMPLLLRKNNKFLWSYRNYFFSLDGKEVARYGKDAEYIEY
jgi:hypothetical protein